MRLLSADWRRSLALVAASAATPRPSDRAGLMLRATSDEQSATLPTTNMQPTDNPPPGRPQSGPYVAECAAGKHAWCRCQRSATYPLCDGSHRAAPAADGAPAPTPLKVTFDAPRRVAWCACGKTGNPPFCDGTHARGRPAN